MGTVVKLTHRLAYQQKGYFRDALGSLLPTSDDRMAICGETHAWSSQKTLRMSHAYVSE